MKCLFKPISWFTVLIAASSVFTLILSANLKAVETNESLIKAQDAPWYDVSIIIYATHKKPADTVEAWPEPRALNLEIPDPYMDLATALAQGEILNFSETPANLLPVIERLSLASKTYRLLHQSSWRQPLYAKDSSQIWLIQGGEQSQGLNELEAYVKISLQRYLHFEIDLRLNRYHEVEQTDSEKSILNTLHANIPDTDTNPEKKASAEPAPNEIDSKLDMPNLTLKDVIQLKQSRRMRSEELHYIDHPLVGILVQVNPADVVRFE